MTPQTLFVVPGVLCTFNALSGQVEEVVLI